MLAPSFFFNNAVIQNLIFGIFKYTKRPYFEFLGIVFRHYLRIFLLYYLTSVLQTRTHLIFCKILSGCLFKMLNVNQHNIRFGRCGSYGYSTFLVIYINPSTLITCKNGLSIINIRSNIPLILYFCKIIFKYDYILNVNILITWKLLVKILN